jgi:hypothetical protein
MAKKSWMMVMAALLAALLLGGSALPTGAVEELPPPHLGYGMMVAYPPDNLGRVKEAGFDWFKYSVYWNDIEPERDGVYDWRTVDWRLDEVCPLGLNLLLRVERASNDWRPIRVYEMAGWQAFFQALASHIAQRRDTCATPYQVAFEIWNEPNLDFQWNYEPVDPAHYTKMVQRAYLGAKDGDPTISIVAGSLAPTGEVSVHAMDDVLFLEAMYANGLSGHFDAISIHNYGFGGAPEDKTWGSGILNFRRAQDIHDVMVAHGDGDKPVWGTEFGWLLDASEEGHQECLSYWDDIGFLWQKVSAEQQADYLRRSFEYADANWPWMGVMIVSGLDFSMLPKEWYATCDPLRWFAVLKPDGSPRLSYTALKEMDKRPVVTSTMTVAPAALEWSLRLRDRDIVTETVTVLSNNWFFPWSVITGTGAGASGPALPFTVTPTLGVAGESFQVTADARDLDIGTYAGIISATAAYTSIIPQVITIPLSLEVFGIWGMDVHPASLSWMMAVSDTHPVSATVAVDNTGDFEFDWTVTQASEALTMTVVPASSTQTSTLTLLPGTFLVTVDSRGLPVGLYTGTLTVTASTTQVPQSPFVLPVSVRIVERLYHVYMPLVMRRY